MIFYGSRSSGCPGSATSPTWTRWPPSPACWCASPPARPTWPTRTWWCCPGPGPPSPTWPGCGTAAWPPRSPNGPGRPPGARHLRRLPDAGRPDRRPGGVAPRRGRRARPAAGARPVRRGEDPRPPAGERAGRAGGRIRDPPRRRRDHRPSRLRYRALPGRLPPRRALGHQLARRPGERRVQARVPGRGGGAGRPGLPPAPDTSFAAVREARLDVLGDLVPATSTPPR